MFLTDALGSVIETISATAGSASVQGNQVYSPYGSSRYQQGSMGTAKGFTGQYNDSISGLDYYGSRYYDPVVGRFLSADALDGNLAGIDPYAYVGGNPETFNDPSGQRYAPPPGGGGSGDGGAAGGGGGDGGAAGGGYLGGNHITFATQDSNPPNNCPGPGSQQTSDCFPMNAAVHSLSLVEVDHSSPLNALGQSVLCSNAGIAVAGGFTVLGGGCGGSLPGKLFSRGKSQMLVPSVASMTFCTKPAVCAGLEAMIEDMAQPSAKDGEITDPETPPGPEGDTFEQLNSEDNMGGPCSFTQDTAVSTDHGKQAIGTLHVGERVLAYNPKTGKMEQEPILHVWINHDSDLVDLTITTTIKGQHGKPATKTSEVVHTNQKHPFFTIEHGFVPVGQIKLGMHLLRADGRIGVVTGWKVVPGTKTMYNLEVAQDHTYTVGAGQWVVHNANCNPVARAKAIDILGKLRKAGADVSHTVIGVGILPDDSLLVAVNDRYTGIDNTQALIDLLKSDYPNATYVGPNGLLPKGVPRGWAAHAENYVQMYALTNGLELQGIGPSLKAGLCDECSAFINAYNPSLTP